MSDRPRVVLALTPIAERQVEPLIFDADPPLDLLASVMVADELAREASERRPDAVLVSPELSGLTQAHCERVRSAGVRLIGLALDQHDRDALGALGVDAIIEHTVSRDELLAAIGPRPSEPAAGLRAGTTSTAPPSPPAPAPVQREHSEQRGSLVAVLAVRGTPGASELAASLSALAARRWKTVLAEVDMLGGNLASRLGVDTGDGSLTGLIRATRTGESRLHELVERWLIQPDGWPLVLLGPTDPKTLAELAQPGVMTRAVDTLAALYPVVVCDVAFPLTDPNQQPVHPHREALISADTVLLVLGPREAQLHAGLRQLEVLLDVLAIPTERVRIIVGQTGSAFSPDKQAILNTIGPHLAERGLSVDAWVPWDERGAKRALQQGRPVALARPHGPYARTVKRLLDELFITAAAVPKAKGRKRRLSVPLIQTAGVRERDEAVWQR